MLIAELSETAQVGGGWREEAALPQNGLDDHGCCFGGGRVLGEHPLDGLQGPVAALPIIVVHAEARHAWFHLKRSTCLEFASWVQDLASLVSRVRRHTNLECDDRSKGP